MEIRRVRTAVCGIAKDEDRYVVEWAAYHLAIGFDRIVIYDNMSARPIASLFDRRALGQEITVIRWPSVGGGNAQLTAYEDFLTRYRTAVDWAAILDLDEYIHLKADPSIASFLGRFPDPAAISINWRIFGSSGHTAYDPRMTIERFRRASALSFDANRLVKTIYRLAATKRIDIHCGDYEDGTPVCSADGSLISEYPYLTQTESNFRAAQINHYFVKSREEWGAKLRRGYTDGTVRPPDMFDLYDRNDVEDDSLLSRAAATRQIMGAIGRRRRGPAMAYLSDTWHRYRRKLRLA